MSVSSSASLASTTGNSLWLSTIARPWPGMCLMQPTTPPRASPSSDRPAQRGDLHRIAAQRAVADHVVRARLADIEHGMVIDRDAHFGQIERQRFGIGARRLDRAGRSDVVKLGEGCPGGIGGPFGRLHPRDAAAFLVDAR